MSRRIFVVADAHVSEKNGNLDAFFAMLRKFEDCPGDIVFLGDIFDLWIGLSRYERTYHHDFLKWCERQKGGRTVGFIEGNHEFFVCQHHRTRFTWCDTARFDCEGITFVHGDLINQHDTPYLRFRRLTKNPVTKFLVRFMPFGVRLVQALKERLRTTNMAHKMGLPEDQIEAFGRNLKRNAQCHESTFLVLGHFHRQKSWTLPGGGVIHALPAWVDSQTVSVIGRTERITLEHVHWQDLNEYR